MIALLVLLLDTRLLRVVIEKRCVGVAVRRGSGRRTGKLRKAVLLGKKPPSKALGGVGTTAQQPDRRKSEQRAAQL